MLYGKGGPKSRVKKTEAGMKFIDSTGNEQMVDTLSLNGTEIGILREGNTVDVRGNWFVYKTGVLEISTVNSVPYDLAERYGLPEDGFDEGPSKARGT